MTPEEMFAALAAPFAPDQVSWRVGSVKKDGTAAMALAYIDARDVMDRLDGVCGPGNWQDRYPHVDKKTVCEIDIYVEGRGSHRPHGQVGQENPQSKQVTLSDHGANTGSEPSGAHPDWHLCCEPTEEMLAAGYIDADGERQDLTPDEMRSLWFRMHAAVRGPAQ